MLMPNSGILSLAGARHIPALAKIDYRYPGIYVGRVYHCIFAAPLMIFISFLAGLIFGIGLIISGMANPAKVVGFLNLAGDWDPSLMLVMFGAIAVGFFAFFWAKSRKTTLFGFEMKLPTAALAWACRKPLFSLLRCWRAWPCTS
jgi:hypothetical protein